MVPTPAELYAETWASAVAVKPPPFMADNREIAWVLPDGNMQMITGPLSPQQAKDLRQWIKANFIESA